MDASPDSAHAARPGSSPVARAERISDLNQLLLTDVAPMGSRSRLTSFSNWRSTSLKGNTTTTRPNHVELFALDRRPIFWRRRERKALGVLDQAYQLSRGLKEAIDSRQGFLRVIRGHGCRSGQLARAEALFEEGWRELSSAAEFGPDRAFCLLRGQRSCLIANGDSIKAVARARAAEEALKESPVASDLQELNVLMNLGGVYGDAGCSLRLLLCSNGQTLS